MDVGQFVHDTLVQIANGVQRANQTFSQTDLTASANPPGAEFTSAGGTTFQGVVDTHEIVFDIAVTIGETTDDSGNSLQVLAASAGSPNMTTTTVSRLNFTVPLKLPRAAPTRQMS